MHPFKESLATDLRIFFVQIVTMQWLKVVIIWYSSIHHFSSTEEEKAEAKTSLSSSSCGVPRQQRIYNPNSEFRVSSSGTCSKETHTQGIFRSLNHLSWLISLQRSSSLTQRSMKNLLSLSLKLYFYLTTQSELCSHCFGCITKMMPFCSRTTSMNLFCAQFAGRALFLAAFAPKYCEISQNLCGKAGELQSLQLLQWGAGGGCTAILTTVV